MCLRKRGKTGAEESSEKERDRERLRDEQTERKIDRDLEDSFPASDPPGWTLGVERPAEEGHDESIDRVG